MPTLRYAYLIIAHPIIGGYSQTLKLKKKIGVNYYRPELFPGAWSEDVKACLLATWPESMPAT